jgi:hypothetical protein
MFGVVLLFDLTAAAEEKAAGKITQISLERSAGKADGPRDTLTFRSDGTASYVGVKNVSRVGEYLGKIPDWYFKESFPRLAEMYRAVLTTGPSTGKPTESVTVVTLRVMVDGKEKVIVDYCPGLDERLWELEMAMRGVAADVTWKKRPVK